MKHFYLLSLFIFSGFLVSCLDDPEMSGELQNAKAPEVTTNKTDLTVTATTIEISGEVVRENGRAVFERGFLYGEETPLTFENSQKKVNEGKGKGVFTDKITGLKNNTNYYICAYAMNENSANGRMKGEEISFSTQPGIGRVSTLAPTEIKATTAVLHAQIDDLGEGEITKRLFYVSKSSKPTSADLVVTGTKGSDNTFSGTVTGLDPHTEYYVLAYVENAFGSFPSVAQKFMTPTGKPEMDSRITIENIDFTKATLRATLLKEGDSPITSRGFIWGTTENVREEGTSIEVNKEGDFTHTLEHLQSGTKYYLCAFATNSFGTSFSADTSFVTKSDAPVIAISSYQIEEDKGTISISGKLESPGISAVTAVGICYDTKNNPTLESNPKSVTTDSNGSFKTTLILKGGQTYYIRAYATNSHTTGYSSEVKLSAPDIFTTQGTFTGYKRIASTVGSCMYASRNQIFLLGGDDLEGNATDEIWMYDAYNKNLQRRTYYPAGKRKLQAVASNPASSQAYIYGGYLDGEAKKECYSYDMSRNTFNEIDVPANGPGALYAASACLTEEALFILGGKDKKNQPVDSVWMYRLRMWTRIGSLPEAQYGGIAVSDGRTVYAGLGIDRNDRGNKTLWVSSDMKNWVEKAVLSDQANGIIRAGVLLGKTIYIIDDLGVIWSHDIESESKEWKQRSQLPARNREVHSMVVLNNVIYIGLGSSGSMITYNPIWDN